MFHRLNQDIVGAIIRADSRGASPEEMRDLYIQRNALDVNLDAPVYRIMALEHLRKDLQEKCLTYTSINKSNWHDASENPLLDRCFTDDVTGLPLTLNGVVSSFYASCWSATALDSPFDWAMFSHKAPSVRVQSTPRKLLDGAMSRANRYYMQQHFIGSMKYVSAEEREAYFADPNWQRHLDSLGLGVALSFLQLSDELAQEDEVRLLYDHLQDPWPLANVRITGHFASAPFDWALVIDGVTVGPGVPNGGEALLRSELQGLGIDCPVTSSPSRDGEG
ncbi:hypothetical protein ACTWM0_22480 [Pseudomonas machongensis]